MWFLSAVSKTEGQTAIKRRYIKDLAFRMLGPQLKQCSASRMHLIVRHFVRKVTTYTLPFCFSGISLDILPSGYIFNIAMENSPFIDAFPIKTTICRGFSMAMLNNQMVSICSMVCWYICTAQNHQHPRMHQYKVTISGSVPTERCTTRRPVLA